MKEQANKRLIEVLNPYVMKTILVSTDYSATASNALEFGANLAQIFKANLVLFNVYHPSIHVSNSLLMPDEIDRIVKNNEDHLEKLKTDTAQRYLINVSCIVRTGETVERLEESAMMFEADLVVMGVDSNLWDYKIFGNTTTAAIHRLKTPILIVPNDVQFKSIKRILYACEYTYLTHDNQLDLLKEITRKFEAELQILHVQTKKQIPVAVDEEIGVVNVMMEDVDHTFSFVDSQNVHDGIVQGVINWQADLLVMVPHKAGFWESLLKSSNTREMAVRTRVPLLVLPNVN
jgi:nucleotide-binding universal stress UspA family protein